MQCARRTGGGEKIERHNAKHTYQGSWMECALTQSQNLAVSMSVQQVVQQVVSIIQAVIQRTQSWYVKCKVGLI